MNKPINFTVVPDEPSDPEQARRTYANFCAVAHTPFDLTLTFCDVRPLSESDVKDAETTQIVRVPVVARVALPLAAAAGLVAALQDQMRAMQESQAAAQPPASWPKEPLH
jgi:hypothetical protein